MSQSLKLPTDLISVGHITGAFGVQGWVRIHPYSVQADALLHAKTWWLGRTEVRGADPETVSDVEKLEAKRHGEDVVARLMGVVGRDAAQARRPEPDPAASRQEQPHPRADPERQGFSG